MEGQAVDISICIQIYNREETIKEQLLNYGNDNKHV